MTGGSVAVADDDGILSSLRYLFADLVGDDDDTPPFLPEAVPERLSPVVSDAIHLLVAYQSTGYARLYVDRLRRFVGRRGVSEAMLGDIARLMAERMAYQDPIRIAQLKLAGLDEAGAHAGSAEVIKFRLDELVEALPAVIAEPALDALEWVGWVRKSRMSIRFSTRTRFGIRRLKIEAGLRRWRLYSVRYARERAWVERWLHMIDRSLTRQPQAASAIVETATMIKGSGEACRQARDHRRPRQTDLRRGPRPVRSCRRDRRSPRGCNARPAAGGAQAQDRRDQGARPGGVTDRCFTRISAAPRVLRQARSLAAVAARGARVHRRWSTRSAWSFRFSHI
jgi:hypothetical protein